MKLLNPKTLGLKLGRSPKHVRDVLAKKPDFPLPVPIDERLSWDEAEVDEWLEKVKANRASAQAKQEAKAHG